MIEFLLNNHLIKTDKPASTTLLDFIRYDENLRGTKIGCREGDCGACTILIGSLKEGKLEYMSVTSCLTPLASKTSTAVRIAVSGERSSCEALEIKYSVALVARSASSFALASSSFSSCSFVRS